MATTTSKRGATKKAKTSSKSASTSKKTTTKKVTKKPAVKKATTAKSTTKTVEKTVTTAVKKTDSSKQFKLWNWILAVLFAGQAVALIALSEKYLYSITTSFQTTDKLSDLAVNAQRTLFDLNILYVVVAGLVAGALLHILFATVLRKKYEAQIQNNVNTLRWVGFSVTVTIAMLVVALVVGITDISTLILIASACVSTGLLAMIRESQAISRKSLKVSSVLAALLPWVVVLIYLIGAGKYGDGGLESFVYYLVASTAVILVLLDVVMYMNIKKKGRFADYAFTDRAYLLVNFVLCSAVAWQVYVSLLK